LETGELDGVLVADPSFLVRYEALPGRRVTNVPYVAAYVLGF
jgi:hypothetical protein